MFLGYESCQMHVQVEMLQIPFHNQAVLPQGRWRRSNVRCHIGAIVSECAQLDPVGEIWSGRKYRHGFGREQGSS